MKTLFDSLVRTFTPIIVGGVLGWFATAGIKLDPEFEPALTLAIGGAFAGLYYLAVRLFELYVSPKFGWLLGLAKPPVYDATGTGGDSYADLVERTREFDPKALTVTQHYQISAGGIDKEAIARVVERQFQALPHREADGLVGNAASKDQVLASLAHLSASEREADIQAAASRINK